MLFYTVDKRGNNFKIVTNGIGKFFELSNFNGKSYIAQEIKPIGFYEHTSRVEYTYIPNKPLCKMTEVYAVEKNEIAYKLGYTFGDNCVYCKNATDFYKILLYEV